MSELKLPADSGGGSVSLKGPASTTSNADVPFVLPVADGSAGQFLKTDGSKNLSFAGGGKIVQFKSTTKKDTTSFSVATDTVYHYTDTSLRVTITPTSASNTLYIMGEVTVGRELLNRVFVVLDKDGSTLATANGDTGGDRASCASVGTNNDTNMPFTIPFHIEIPAENTSERYYNLGFHHGSSSSRTIYLNRSSGDSDVFHQPRTISTISVMEVAP